MEQIIPPNYFFWKMYLLRLQRGFQSIVLYLQQEKTGKGWVESMHRTLTDLQTLKPIKERIALYYFTLKPTSKCMYKVFKLDMPQKKHLLGHQKCTFKL